MTRARAQASELVARLAALGAATVEVPAIEIVDPDDGGAALAAAVERLAVGDYDWLVLTSPNGARRLLDALRARGPRRPGARRRAAGRHRSGHRRARWPAREPGARPGAAPVRGRVAARARSRTRRRPAARRAGCRPGPGQSRARRRPDRPPGAGTGRVLLARAAVARDVLPEGLAARGWAVDVVDAYRSEPVPLTPARGGGPGRGRDRDVHVVVHGDQLPGRGRGPGRPPRRSWPPSARSPPPPPGTTGSTVAVEAEVHTIDGLVDALVVLGGRAPRSPTHEAAGRAGARLRRPHPRHRDLHLRGGGRHLRQHGVELDRAEWQAILGTADHPHWTDMLAARLGRPVDREAPRRGAGGGPAGGHRHPAALRRGGRPAGGGRGGRGAGARWPRRRRRSWVVPHLERLGLRDRFAAVVTPTTSGATRAHQARARPVPGRGEASASPGGAAWRWRTRPTGCGGAGRRDGRGGGPRAHDGGPRLRGRRSGASRRWWAWTLCHLGALATG